MTRFALSLLALVTTTTVASANVEIGGTAGAHLFSDKSALGFVPGSNQTTEGNSTLFALRLGVYFTPALGVEVEGGAIPAEPRKMVFDIWDFAGRASLIYQFRTAAADNSLLPFISVGAGALAVVMSNNTDIIKKDTQPFGSVGVGAKYRTSGGWGVRVDARVNIGKANSASSGIAPDIEVLASLYREFGANKKKAEVIVPPKKEEDPDHDGIVGAADKCPNEAEDKDGFQDADGCPDPDNDGDGIPDDKDKCPNEAEDKDNFQDDDGCPDPDNDGDGIPDVADKCPDQPETKNGFQDEDGCPDEIPEKVKQFTGAIQGINFKTNAADLAPGSTATLDRAVAVLNEFKDVKLEIGGHTDDQPIKSKTFADNQALSQARAESVKAYFVKKGIDEARLTAKGYGDSVPLEDPKDLKGGKLNSARAKNRRVEFKLVSGEAAAAPAPAPTPAPTPPTP